MDLEKVIRKQQIKDDINFLTEEELYDKYAKDENSAKYFLHLFHSVFVAKSFYPVMIYDKYDLIKGMVADIKAKLEIGDEFRLVADEILDYMKMELSFIKNYEEKHDRTTQMSCLNNSRLAIDAALYCYDFATLNEILLEETQKIADCYYGNRNFPNYKDYEYMMRRAAAKGNAYDETNTIDDYFHEFPLLYLCHEKEFLFTVNELLFSTDVTTEDKKDLINLAGNVIDFSLTYNPYNKNNGFDKKEYRAVAKKTLNNIKEFEKTLEPEKKKPKTLKKIVSVNIC